MICFVTILIIDLNNCKCTNRLCIATFIYTRKNNKARILKLSVRSLSRLTGNLIESRYAPGIWTVRFRDLTVLFERRALPSWKWLLISFGSKSGTIRRLKGSLEFWVFFLKHLVVFMSGQVDKELDVRASAEY